MFSFDNYFVCHNSQRVLFWLCLVICILCNLPLFTSYRRLRKTSLSTTRRNSRKSACRSSPTCTSLQAVCRVACQEVCRAACQELVALPPGTGRPPARPLRRSTKQWPFVRQRGQCSSWVTTGQEQWTDHESTLDWSWGRNKLSLMFFQHMAHSKTFTDINCISIGNLTNCYCFSPVRSLYYFAHCKVV